MTFRIDSVCIGKVTEYPPDEFDSDGWTTATYKYPVSGPLRMDKLGIEGDEQSDRRNHGGVDKAVLAYSGDHYPLWQSELGRPDFAAGALGENLTISGADESKICIGDRFSFGAAFGTAVVEVSQPRQPCWKQSRRWNRQDLVALIQQSGRTGWYLRVVQPGSVEAGMSCELLERPSPEWTIARANRILYFERDNISQMKALAGLAQLSDSWKSTLTRRIHGAS